MRIEEAAAGLMNVGFAAALSQSQKKTNTLNAYFIGGFE